MKKEEAKERVTDALHPRVVESGVVPSLPNFDDIVRMLGSICLDIQHYPASEKILEDFYYPLIATAHRLGRLALNKLHEFPTLGEEEKLIEQWFWGCSRATGEVIELLASRMSKGNDLLERVFVESINDYDCSPFQWSIDTLVWIAQWISRILEKGNHHGHPPFYIYISRKDGDASLHKLPRVYEGDQWLSGFGGRLFVPSNVSRLTAAQKAELWNILLVEENIYGDQTIDHSMRENVFNGVLHLFPEGNVRHLDLCGGKGDFIVWLRERRPEISSVLIDIADQAVQVAISNGIVAQVGNAEEPLQFKEEIDVISIIFAIQWLSPKAYGHVFQALKPGGCLIVNIYPPDLNQIEALFRDTLEKSGFVNIQLEVVETKDGEKQSLIRAQKPE